MAAPYRIPDEPTPSRLSELVVDPFWPLLAVMFGGAWLSWPWFVFNGFAIGSPARWRQAAVAALGLLGTLGIVVGLQVAAGQELVARGGIRYLALFIVAAKLGTSYWLYWQQQRPYQLWEHFGGTPKRGFVVLAVAFLLGPRLEKVFWEAAPMLGLLFS